MKLESLLLVIQYTWNDSNREKECEHWKAASVIYLHINHV